MNMPGTFQLLAVGALVLVVLLWFRPGIRAALEQSRRAEERDWRGLLLPLALVVLFVVLLIASV